MFGAEFLRNMSERFVVKIRSEQPVGLEWDDSYLTFEGTGQGIKPNEEEGFC